MYAGTISLNNEAVKVSEGIGIQTGDILITAESPGHAMIVAGRAFNSAGKMVCLIAEGYTPAESIHIITNPYSKTLNRWYELSLGEMPKVTARYSFLKTNIRMYAKGSSTVSKPALEECCLRLVNSAQYVMPAA